MKNEIRRWVLFALFSVIGAFSALSFAETKPEFSHATSAKWYYVKFKAGGMYLTGHGPGKPLTVEAFTGGKEQKWMLQGDETNFSLTTLDNYNVMIADGIWDEKINNRPAVGDANQKDYFKLFMSSTIGRNSGYEIESLKMTEKCLNTWGGVEAGTGIGLWKKNDVNNKVEFIPVDQAGFEVQGITNYQPKEKNTLWYNKPAKDYGSNNAWMEYALPIGNGQLGASIFGGVKNDEIIFNDKTLWTGRSTSVGTDNNGNEYGSFQTFGAVVIEDQNNLGKVTNYLRDLNLANATASMSYTCDGVDYKREYIVSNPDSVIATHLTATPNGKINIKVTLSPRMVKGAGQVTYSNGEAHFAGQLDVVSFDARMKVVAEGGRITTNNRDITVTDANEVLIVVTGGTDFDNSKPNFVSGTDKLLDRMKRRVQEAVSKKWEALYKKHVEDYKNFYDRVSLNFTGAENTMPTNLLVDAYQKGDNQNVLMLEQLYFNYGRYLEIASSRGVNLPSNLQGIWTNNNKAAWNADIHANINVQMNYWPAEPTNLSEMHEPFLNYIIEMADSEPWLRYANEAGAKGRGWTCYTENNIFGGVGVWAHNYVIVNAWYCSHLWQHYRYTLDEAFLEKAFPAMLSAAQFWMDRLILRDGKYVCPNEYSPEHGPQKEDGVAHAQQLVWELFDNTLKAVKVLGEKKCKISKQDLGRLNELFARLDTGLEIETYTGKWGNRVNGVSRGSNILREWKYSTYDAGNNGHRHMSHLMCLYPFSQVTSGSDLFNAAVNSLRLRGDQSTGWSMGWKINLWARALDGNHAHDILRLALRHSTSYDVVESAGGIYYNLFDSHAPFQIDGNFGACAGMAEMLFQSHQEVLHFLPALPNVWNSGSVTGLKGIGNFTASVDWANGQATKITIVNNKGQKCLVRCTRAAKAINTVAVTVNGRAVVPVATDQPDVFEIPSKGLKDVIIFDFSKDAGVEPQPEPDYAGVCGDDLTWHLEKNSGVLTISGTGAMYDYSEQRPAPWTPVADEVKSIVLPEADSFTHIGNYAFAACQSVKSMIFYNNEVTIGEGAFASETKTRLIINDDDYRNTAFPLTENSYSEIEYLRTLDDGKWGTMVLPFTLNTETALHYNFYTLASAGENVLTFKYVRIPMANIPYLYRNADGAHGKTMVSAGKTKIKANGSSDVIADSWTMLGCYRNLTVSGTDLARTYVLSQNKILNSTQSIEIGTFRAYFNGPEYNPSKPSMLRIVIEGEDGEMTDISEVLADQLRDNGVVYDLAGRRVWKTLPDHIYIKNGKKFIAK